MPAHPRPELYALLDAPMSVAARAAIKKSIHRLRSTPPNKRERIVATIKKKAEAATTAHAEHVRNLPAPTLVDDLPISAASADIISAIQEHQVVIVAGETGSGKTTQLPKIALLAGRGKEGLIGHTQPRRIAARSVATRIAEEMNTPLGGSVGYAVRFTDTSSDDTVIRLMTDGILLAEISRDPLLTKYDTIIVDEAHERSLNIDFLLGYLHRLMAKRRDLRIIITSATIDVDRFSEHFNNAPIIEVSGRTYPVEVRYRPLQDPDDDTLEDRDQVTGIVDAVSELCKEGPGDILVFLSGEREIHDARDALSGAASRFKGPRPEIVPLFARLSAGEQNKIFTRHSGRRVVLSTNVAETSLTVPGIRYVVDVGTARISRYSHRLKVQRLPIEPVSKASANQRAGRCGRVSEGICIRLYSEDDYESRPQFTEPEILRTNLASVMLNMMALRLGKVEDFPFIAPPDHRHVRDGMAMLTELGATGARGELTPTGRLMSKLPIDPRIARMIIAGCETDCAPDVLTIAAALSIQDPRERPLEAQGAADQSHARFTDKTSDFLTYLNLWDYLQKQQKEMGSSAFRRLCKNEYLHYVRIREWQDVRGQLQSLAKDLQLSVGTTSGDPDAMHKAILSGLLSHIGSYDERTRDYVGARNAHFAIFPGSSVKKKPELVMAGELVETSRLWGRDVAVISPEWVEAVGAHMVSRSYSEPHWSASRGSVVATEKVSLLGVPLITDRQVTFHRVDPHFAREEFIRKALVEGDWNTRHAFFHHNRSLLADAEELSTRVRRADVIVDDDELFAFYDSRIPSSVVSARHFDSWWKKARRENPSLLEFDEDMLYGEAAADVESADYPSHWLIGDVRLPLSYENSPGSESDGVTCHIDVALLNQITPQSFEWQIPGLRPEVVTALLRALPKALRRQLVPMPDLAHAICSSLPAHPTERSLTHEAADVIAALRRVEIPDEAWDWSKVPDRLRITFSIETPSAPTSAASRGKRRGKGPKPSTTTTVLATGKDLAALISRTSDAHKTVVRAAAKTVRRENISAFPEEGVPLDMSNHTARTGGVSVQGFGAIVAGDGGLTVDVLPHADAAEAATRVGVRELILRQAGGWSGRAATTLGTRDRLLLASSGHGGIDALLKDTDAAIVDSILTDHGSTPRTPEEFDAALARVKSDAPQIAERTMPLVVAVLAAVGSAQSAVPKSTSMEAMSSLADVRDYLASLVAGNFVTRSGIHRLPDLRRYAAACEVRLAKIEHSARADADALRTWQALWDRYDRLSRKTPADRPLPHDVRELTWLFHELRIHLLAQGARTGVKVSVKRVSDRLTTFGV